MSITPTLTEEQIQAQFIEYLQLTGHEVLQTSRRGVFCRHCRRKVYGPDGATKGLPDLLFTHKKWFSKRGWVGVEVKGAKTAVSDEQKRLAELGFTRIVRSLDELMEITKEVANGA